MLDFKVNSAEAWESAKRMMTLDEDRIPWDYLKKNYDRWRAEGHWISAGFWFGFDVAHSWMMGTETMLVAMLEGAENGGAFALLMSVFYYLSGSAPGPYVVVLVTAVAILGSLYRQGYWSQSMSSTLLCSFLSMVTYEILLMVTGIFLHLTVLRRIGVFFTVAVLTTIVLVPLYYIARGIGQIGGELWKE